MTNCDVQNYRLKRSCITAVVCRPTRCAKFGELLDTCDAKSEIEVTDVRVLCAREIFYTIFE